MTVLNDFEKSWNVTDLEPEKYPMFINLVWPDLTTHEFTSFPSRAMFWIKICTFCAIIRHSCGSANTRNLIRLATSSITSSPWWKPTGLSLVALKASRNRLRLVSYHVIKIEKVRHKLTKLNNTNNVGIALLLSYCHMIVFMKYFCYHLSSKLF